MSPPERLAERLALDRDAGADFAEAWGDALDCAVAGDCEVADWRAAFEATREHWHAAWLCQPMPTRVAALVMVAQDPERVPLDADERVEVCAHCDRALRGYGRSKYCSERCRRETSAMKRIAA